MSRRIIARVGESGAPPAPAVAIASVEQVEKTEQPPPESGSVDWHPGNMANPSPKIEKLKLTDLTRDFEINCRAGGTRPEVVAEYSEALGEGASFPPVIVFRDPAGKLWLADGFHRAAAHDAAGRLTIEAEVRAGDRRAAMFCAAGANQDHGARRTAKDKRRSVAVLLKDEQWSKMSNREIARHAGVSDPFVGELRDQLLTVSSSPRKGRDGKVRSLPKAKGTAPKRKRRSAFERDALVVAGMAAAIAKRARRVIEHAEKAQPLEKGPKEKVLQRIKLARDALGDLVDNVLTAGN